MVDSTLIDTQNFANRPGGLDFMEVRTILPLWTKKMNALRVSASVSYNLSELQQLPRAATRDAAHAGGAGKPVLATGAVEMVGTGILHAGAWHGFSRAVVG